MLGGAVAEDAERDPGRRDFRWQFLLLELATAAATLFAAHRPERSYPCFRSLAFTNDCLGARQHAEE